MVRVAALRNPGSVNFGLFWGEAEVSGRVSVSSNRAGEYCAAVQRSVQRRQSASVVMTAGVSSAAMAAAMSAGMTAGMSSEKAVPSAASAMRMLAEAAKALSGVSAGTGSMSEEMEAFSLRLARETAKRSLGSLASIESAATPAGVSFSGVRLTTKPLPVTSKRLTGTSIALASKAAVWGTRPTGVAVYAAWSDAAI